MAAFTTNAVAERAGVSIGTLYQYFANKNAIALALAKREREMVLAEIAQTLRGEADPAPEARVRSMVRVIVNAFGGRAFDHGTAYIIEGARAAALWLPPGVEPDEAAMDAIVAQALRPEIADDLGFVLQGMAEHHPHEPHWYLPLIAADPNWIGQGLGTLLMKHALRRCDDEGIAAYLESSNPRNISFYERHGFRIIGEIQHGSSPMMTPMLRPAA